MTTRRRKWIIAATLLVLAAAMWWCFGWSGGRTEVKLVFLGITNGPDGTTHALVLATNSGNSTAILYGTGFEYGPGALEPLRNLGFKSPIYSPFHLPAPGIVFPAQLKPGQTIRMSMPFTRLDEPMEAGLFAKRCELNDRLYCRMMSSMNIFMMRLAGTLLSQPPSTTLVLDPVTNLPPASAASPAPRVARP
jgi:hypothetical protein